MRAGAYSEAHGGGAPLLYQTFVLTASTAGFPPAGPLPEIASALGHGEWSPGDRRSDPRMSPSEPVPEEFEDIPKIGEMRRDMGADASFGPSADA